MWLKNLRSAQEGIFWNRSLPVSQTYIVEYAQDYKENSAAVQKKYGAFFNPVQ